MERFFNTEGPCDEGRHYMLPAESRLGDEVGRLIERQRYFVIHAPRQVGKTTAFRALARRLTAEGRYAALLTTCEVGQSIAGKVEDSIDSVLDALRLWAEEDLPEELPRAAGARERHADDLRRPFLDRAAAAAHGPGRGGPPGTPDRLAEALIPGSARSWPP